MEIKVKRFKRVDDRTLFEELKHDWIKERRFSSNIDSFLACPSYLRIIGLGWRMVPFIIEELREPNRPPWRPALEAITGINPVPPEDKGNNYVIAKSWEDWYLEQGWEYCPLEEQSLLEAVVCEIDLTETTKFSGVGTEEVAGVRKFLKTAQYRMETAISDCKYSLKLMEKLKTKSIEFVRHMERGRK